MPADSISHHGQAHTYTSSNIYVTPIEKQANNEEEVEERENLN